MSLRAHRFWRDTADREWSAAYGRRVQAQMAIRLAVVFGLPTR